MTSSYTESHQIPKRLEIVIFGGSYQDVLPDLLK